LKHLNRRNDVEKGIPEASREILREWQTMGLKINVNNMIEIEGGFWKFNCDASKYTIPEQPIPAKLLEEPEAKWDASNPIEWLPHSFTIKLVDAESDPHGTDPHSPGAKLDAGKNRLGLVLGGFAKALEEVGKVGTYGAEKYSPNGWKSVPDGLVRYEDAMMRHWLTQHAGEKIDPTTGLMHQAQLVWNALAVLELMLREENKNG